MRVAVLLDAIGRHGGIEAYLVSLHRALESLGHQLVVVTGRCERDTPYPVAIVPVRAWTRTGRVLAFAEAARDWARAHVEFVTLAFRHVYEADVYMPHGGWIESAWEGRERSLGDGVLGTPLRRAWRHLARRGRVFARLERSVVTRAQAVIAISQRVAHTYRELHGANAAPCVTLPLGVDLERFAPEGPSLDLRAELGIPGQAPSILFAGYNARLKGLRHAALAMRAIEDAHLIVCGPDARTVRRALRRDTSMRIHVLGSRDDMPALYRSVDVLLHPTYFDPCSLVVLEAMACGTPCVTTRCNGASEVGGEGLVLLEEPDDVRSAEAGLRRLLAARGVARRAARRAMLARDAREHFAELVSLLSRVAR